MEFKSLRNIESSFRQIRLFGIVFLSLCAQWVVSDPGNLAQGIINASKNIIHTSKTATNMVSNFQETVKIYQQGKKYYDALKSVNNLVKDAEGVKGKHREGGEHPQHDAAACFRRQAVQIPFETCRQAFPFVVEFPIHAPH
jgi:hypothetical protein